MGVSCIDGRAKTARALYAEEYKGNGRGNTSTPSGLLPALLPGVLRGVLSGLLRLLWAFRRFQAQKLGAGQRSEENQQLAGLFHVKHNENIVARSYARVKRAYR